MDAHFDNPEEKALFLLYIMVGIVAFSDLIMKTINNSF